jgi:hypothetical protein
MSGRRRHFLGTALAVAAALALLPAAAPAAPIASFARAVDRSDFPTVAEIAASLPAYAGGERHVEADHPVWIFKSDCSAYENGPSGIVRKWAYYYAADSDQPSLPRVHVQEFATVSAARRAIRTIRRNAEGCYGVHRVPSIDGTLIRRPADVPPLGAGTPVAWKMNDHWTDQDTGIRFAYYSRRIWMREGETIIGVDLWGDEPQSRDAAVRLARLALRTVD